MRRFLRAITLRAGRTKLANSSFLLDVDLGTLDLETNVTAVRTISEDNEFYAFWASYLLSLTFLTGAGWFIGEHLVRLIRMHFAQRLPR